MFKKLNVSFEGNSKRVLLQFFDLGEQRSKNIINRVLMLNDVEAKTILDKTLQKFAKRHANFNTLLIKNYLKVRTFLPEDLLLTQTQELLIGAYFSKEYSIESAALFNPSIVLHPDQSDLSVNQVRFVISMRAVGEGHISSIEFHDGIFDGEKIIFNPYTNYVSGASCKTQDKVFAANTEVITKSANYDLQFDKSIAMSERIIFPSSVTESNGMEDLRLVRFEDDGKITYYGTFTAYDGHNIHPQILETENFSDFKIRTLSGAASNDKGMALFPRKVNGKYVMISRQDGENIRIMYSDDIYTWKDSNIILTPNKSWGLVQLGNCGSPIEVDEGWLLLTHAVGPFRRYVISACLLDKDDPSKVIAELESPLLEPDEDEREGYVPNVVYTCGVLKYVDKLLMPYAASDTKTCFGVVDLKSLLKQLKH